MDSISLIDDSCSPDLWNSVAEHPLQSWEWGMARKETGVEVLRVGCFNGQKLSQVFLITLHKIPYTPYKIGYVPKSAFPDKKTLDFLHHELKKRGVVFVKFEPDVTRNMSAERDTDRSMIDARLKPSPHPLFPEWNQVLDINPTEEELAARLKPKTRYNIRLAERHGVKIKEVTSEEGFEDFITLYFDTCKRQHYRGHTHSYHKTIFNHLQNRISHILVAYYNDRPLSAYELFLFNKKAYYPYGGSSHLFKNVMASNLLMWEAILFAKEHGAKQFDMWGSLPPDYDPKNPWSGFTRFKEGYGTEFVRMAGSYDFVLMPLVYPLYNTIYSLRKVAMQTF